MAIYVCFSTDYTSWFSRLIRWATQPRVPISHSFLSIETNYIAEHPAKREITVGAEKHVEWVPLTKFKHNNTVTARFTVCLGVDRLLKTVRWLEETYWQADYEISGALAIGIKNKLKWLWSVVGKWWRSKLKPKRVICTELVIRALIHAGCLTDDELDVELTDAPTLCKILYKHTNFKLIDAHCDVITFLNQGN